MINIFFKKLQNYFTCFFIIQCNFYYFTNQFQKKMIEEVKKIQTLLDLPFDIEDRFI